MRQQKRFTGEERKKQILLSAVKVFAQSNYKTARVADIARDVGISEASIYKYFPSKKAIFIEILEHISQRIITFWEEEFDKEQDALKALGNMGITYFSRMIKHPNELKVQFQAISEINDQEIANRLHQDHEYYLQFIMKVIKKGIQQGSIRKDLDIDALSWIFNGVGITLNTAVLLSFRNEFNEQRVSWIVAHIIESIRK